MWHTHSAWLDWDIDLWNPVATVAHKKHTHNIVIKSHSISLNDHHSYILSSLCGRAAQTNFRRSYKKRRKEINIHHVPLALRIRETLSVWTLTPRSDQTDHCVSVGWWPNGDLYLFSSYDNAWRGCVHTWESRFDAVLIYNDTHKS